MVFHRLAKDSEKVGELSRSRIARRRSSSIVPMPLGLLEKSIPALVVHSLRGAGRDGSDPRRKFAHPNVRFRFLEFGTLARYLSPAIAY